MTNDNIQDFLSNQLKEIKAPPFLFIGSGLSRRYINTPAWDELLRIFAKKVNNDNVFAYESYFTQAKQTDCKYGVNPQIATLIEKDFNKCWFTDPRYEEHRKNNYDFIKKRYSPLKIELAEYFKELTVSDYNDGMKNEIDLLTNVGDRSIAGVITTNYDGLIEEKIFSKYNYQKFIGQEELIFSSIASIGEIYKIHGCYSNPNSIIINEEDYKSFDEKYDYLAAKLLTIFMEHPIIFLGYGLNDSNIKKILESIAKCLSEENLKKLTNRFIFIEWNNSSEDNKISTHTISFSKIDKSISMTKIYIDDYSYIYKALLQNKVSYNPRLIKNLKKDIYNVVLSSKTGKNLKVLLDVDDDKLEEVETIIGFGIFDKLGINGYGSFSANDLFMDLIIDKDLNKKLVVELTLPIILKSTSSVPMFKYIKNYKDKLPDSINKYKDKIQDISYFYTKKIKEDKKTGKNILKMSIPTLVAQTGLELALKQIAYIEDEYLKANDLKTFIKDYLNQYPNALESPKCTERAEIKRLIKMYDFLEYK